MRTYSALRSHVQTVEVETPAPRPTVNTMSPCFRYSAASGAASSYGRPSLKRTVDPTVTAARASSGVPEARGHRIDRPHPGRRSIRCPLARGSGVPEARGHRIDRRPGCGRLDLDGLDMRSQRRV